ncbi:hypothetical protein ACFWY6_17230 [Streptomyces sp. NPDC059037]|uniref:hypothetical protein n=1 Tax=Streptomyces sp. NPDC059037 TaxID=3346710 RepID=UPI00369E0F7E
MDLAAGQVETERLADDFVANAGMHGANYPELGAAWGMTHQGVRKRWPHPVTTEAVNPSRW